MNKNNESNLLDSFMDEGEGAPELSENGGSSVGPNFRLQDSQSDTPMTGVVSSDRLNAPYVHQVMTPTHFKPGPGQNRTSLGVNNPVINTPTNISVSSVSEVLTSGNNNSVSDSMVSPVSSGKNSLVTSPSTPARKRLKMVDNEKPTHSDDISSLKKRILEHKLLKLKSIRERYAEHTAELFYLQADGNMMDYQAWRKRPPTPQLLSFFRTHCLEPGEGGEELSRALGLAPLLPTIPPNPVVPHGASVPPGASVPQSPSVPQGAEIKIPGVGATPVAVSTTLPAAVAQLTQRGSLPGLLAGGRHGMVFAPLRHNASVAIPTQPGGTPLIVEGSSSSPAPKASPPASAPSTPTAQEHMVEKAKQEAYVMQRISELQKEGLWTEKRLPKVMEPARPKAHWDYLLEEMVWLAADFAQERKWKKAAAKKCARMVQKHFHEKAMMAQKAEKAQELHLRRIAAFAAKEIKTFWSNVEKLVEFKQQTRLEEQRKQALDQQLSFIVDQTEKYSQQLAEGMRQQTAPTSTNTSTCPSDEEFSPSDALSSDDEETIAAAEKLDVKDGQRQAEVEALQRESEMDLDQFLSQLPHDYLQNRDNIQLSEPDSDGDDAAEDSEFQAEEDSTDDEDTIMEQEKQEGQHDHTQEIHTLKAEGEMTIQELMKMYSGAGPGATTTDMSPPPTDDDRSDNDSTENEDTDSTEESETEMDGLDVLVKDGTETDGTSKENQDDDDHRMEDAAAIAESIQPKGNTLSSTQVVTKVPFLLKHSLREYQHIGLDWLVTMEQRRLNGILADEMGLGKTIQTIALISHLACEKQDWGPHLIVVPTSVMLNWEMEFKKWCPAFKILTYYGTIKERKLKRIGWTKPNAFHICITSYKLVIQDHQSFRRKKWKYLILDEAQNIKNFKSQRWQLLLNFQTQQRLLLTGTPLQNNLMELWSLMHFLMPDVFASHREFKEWFSNPVSGMIEGNSEYNETIIKRLHKVLRPFLLRRLKCEVEKQMPKKYEHVVMCRLSKRQRFLYEDFMSRAKTKETLATGNLLSVINVLMQLRKVCNHPNLFEVRPIISPFQMAPIHYHIPSIVYNATNYDPFTQIDFAQLNLNLLLMERTTTAFTSHRVHHLSTPRKLIEEIDNAPPSPPSCPTAEFRMHISIRPAAISAADAGLQTKTSVLPGTSPRMYTKNDPKKIQSTPVNTTPANTKISKARPVMRVPPLQSGDSPKMSVSTSSMMGVGGGLKVALVQPLTPRVIRQLSAARTAQVSPIVREKTPDTEHSEFKQASLEEVLRMRRKSKLSSLASINDRRCSGFPLYGCDLRDQVTVCPRRYCQVIEQDINTLEGYVHHLKDIFERFVVHIPAACSAGVVSRVSHGAVWRVAQEERTQSRVVNMLAPLTRLLHPITSRMSTHFPDPRLIQYDCGKLQTLNLLLRKLKDGQHRVLIFTQMTKMLDILEAFLNCHGHIYLRLDGTTRVDQRQVLMERFNADPRIFVFILSTRSGGVGVNLTGADTVIFYDSDWNPTMDAQAQDRCHRIGQTRDVHIYRLISEMTVEENILKKANQKRMLGDVAIEGGNFTTAYFKSSTIQDLFNVDVREQSAPVSSEATEASSSGEGVSSALALECALAQCEDEADVAAAKGARAEAVADLAEFDENIPIEHNDVAPPPEMTKAEAELHNLVQQLSPVERYAMRLVEASDAATSAEKQAAAEMDKQLKDWEVARRAIQRQPELPSSPPTTANNDDDDLTFSREDANNQIWISDNTEEQMPMWCPPTPPQGDDDVYIDASMRYLYEWNVMTETQLPPVYVKRDLKRSRADMGHSPDGRRPLKMHRKEESVYAPRSLFERPSPATAKLRRDLKLQKYRGVVRTPASVSGLKPTPRPYLEPENVPEWTVAEEMALLQAIKLQGLPLNLVILSPAHTPNWDLSADMVNNVSRIYRSPRQCRNRYESVILPREEGKALLDTSQKKQKKTKGICKTPTQQKASRSMRTAQLYELDNNVSYTQAILSKYDSMKFILNKKASTPKRRYDDPTMKNPKHAAVLAEYGINYDNAPSPMDVAMRRADRIAKEKQKAAPSSVVSSSAAEQVSVARLVSKPASTPPPAAAPSPAPAPVALVPARLPVQRTVQTQAQEQMVRPPQRIVVAAQQVSNVVAKGITTGTITAGGKPLNHAQYQLYKQQALVKQQQQQQQLKILQQQQHAAGSVAVSGVQTSSSPASVPLQQQRTQVAQTSALGKATVARTVTEGEISALLKRQQALGQHQQKGQQHLAQMFTTAVSQQGQPIQVATVSIAGGVAKTVSGVAGMAGVVSKAPMKMATPQQLRQLQLQQQLALVQRKAQKVTQLTQVSGGVGVSGGVVGGAGGVSKTLPAGVTVQQLQQVMRQMPSARVLPRPTIQVVGGARSSTAVGSVNHQVLLSAALQARANTTHAHNQPDTATSSTPPGPAPAQQPPDT